MEIEDAIARAIAFSIDRIGRPLPGTGTSNGAGARCTSAATTTPPGPEPLGRSMSVPSCAASRRASGEALFACGRGAARRGGGRRSGEALRSVP
ncbi:MAG: hypothetical protein R3F42_15085 [Pseudomonadota bacterium]